MTFNDSAFHFYQPGQWPQDAITLPLEASLAIMINMSYTPHQSPIWPFAGEPANETTSYTHFPRNFLLPIAAGAAAGILTGLKIHNDHFPLWVESRGWVHALLLTELATSTAKVTFQRKRPFFDTALAQDGKTSDDDRYSFFSGHASHAFSFATYSSLMMFKYAPSKTTAWVYSICAYSAAGIVSYSRVTDHAHNLSDVLVGAFVGTLVSAAVFSKVSDAEENALHKEENKISWKITPRVLTDQSQHVWYGGDFEVRY